jgi:hypothetical protein
MKTSNKLLVAATTLIIVYLVAYDLSIKAEYMKGDYKSRFYGFDQMPVKDFDAITDSIGNTVDVIIEQGPAYAVWLNRDTKKDFNINVKNKNLSINFKPDKVTHPDVIYVICPKLHNLNVKAAEERGGGGSNTSISGFKQDSMQVYGRGSSLIHLSENVVKQLNIDISGFGILLDIGNTNKIVNGNFNIGNEARFELLGPVVEKPVYNVSDKATVTLTGETMHKSSLNFPKSR